MSVGHLKVHSFSFKDDHLGLLVGEGFQILKCENLRERCITAYTMENYRNSDMLLRNRIIAANIQMVSNYFEQLSLKTECVVAKFLV